tara:strand:- start:802 stop:1506 length:705 start_codon:yes stop_codon:yes gene_type:complete
MSDPGCPRCRDYEDLKRELENQKERLKEKQNKDLLSCEKEKKALQKKVLQFGAAAVIGGTILGKEFVDTVASYIESFGNVTNVMPNLPVDLVSSTASGPVDNPVDDQDLTPAPPSQSTGFLSAPFFYMTAFDPAQGGFGGSVAYEDLILGYGQGFDFLSGNEPDDPMEYLRRLTRAFSETQEESFELTVPPLFDFGMDDEMPKIDDLEYAVVSENYVFVPLAAIPLLFYRRRRK